MVCVQAPVTAPLSGLPHGSNTELQLHNTSTHFVVLHTQIQTQTQIKAQIPLRSTAYMSRVQSVQLTAHFTAIFWIFPHVCSSQNSPTPMSTTSDVNSLSSTWILNLQICPLAARCLSKIGIVPASVGPPLPFQHFGFLHTLIKQAQQMRQLTPKSENLTYSLMNFL